MKGAAISEFQDLIVAA